MLSKRRMVKYIYELSKWELRWVLNDVLYTFEWEDNITLELLYDRLAAIDYDLETTYLRQAKALEDIVNYHFEEIKKNQMLADDDEIGSFLEEIRHDILTQ